MTSLLVSWVWRPMEAPGASTLRMILLSTILNKLQTRLPLASLHVGNNGGLQFIKTNQHTRLSFLQLASHEIVHGWPVRHPPC